MIGLAWQLARAGGWPRFLLLAGCTAVVSGLLLVAATLLRLHDYSEEQLLPAVADPGTRGGVVLATVLLTIPPLLLLDQAVRLGTASRERRLAALRMAGVTPGEVRRLGAVEVGIPTVSGAVVGIAVFEMLRALVGGGSGGPVAMGNSTRWGLIPLSVSPTWWQMASVVLGVSVLGILVGYRASRRVVSSPLVAARQQTRPAPRPWGLLGLVAAAFLALPAMSNSHATDYLVFVAIGLAMFGIINLAPWVAHRVARFTANRARSAETILASERIVADPRPAGRAAAAVGGIGMVAGGAFVVLAFVISMDQPGGEFVISILIVLVGLAAALLVVCGSIAVHTVESLLDRKREVAFLAATGMPVAELERAQRTEAVLVTVPTAMIGVLIGIGLVGALGELGTPASLLVILAGAVGTMGAVWLATILAVRAVRSWAARAALPENLRTE